MSRIYELIAQLCPRGVAFKTLGDVLGYEQPTKYLVASTAYDNAYETPVLTAGQTFVLGYTDETDGVYPASPDTPAVIFDDFTTAFKWVDFPFKAKSSAMKMLTPKSEAEIDFKYVFYVMQTIRYEPQDHARQWIGTYSRFRVPIPPVEVQREIVRILDLFTSLEAELEAELEKRRQQYAHYRDALLTVPQQLGVRVVPMGELTVGISSGKNKLRSTIGAYPVYGSTGLLGFADQAPYSGEMLLVARVGAYAGLVKWVSGDFDVSDNTLIVRTTGEWDVRFAFHQLAHLNINQYAKGGGQPLVTAGLLKRLEIPVPPLAEQQRIANILDKFDVLTTDHTVGLPAEINARRQQYEFYRDRLLAFEEAAA